MANRNQKQPSGVPNDIKTRYKDMGDGTHALVGAGYQGVLNAAGTPLGLAGTTMADGSLAPKVYGGILDASALPHGIASQAMADTSHAIKTYGGYLDTTGAATGYKVAGGKPRISSMLYTYDIAEGNVEGHSVWTKIGYTPTMNATESDLWSAAGVYAFPAAAQQMEVVSSNAGDASTAIKAGTSTGGSTTSLIDTGANFTAATAVVAGDCVLLDKSGASPEWGYVTAVAATVLTVAGGFSAGGSGSGRAYSVVDKSAQTGAQAVKVEYLDGSYQTKAELVILNGTTPVDTVNTDLFRINSFRVIATGTNNKPLGNLSLRNTAGTVTYSYITLGFTRARNSAYTVPAGKTLYVTEFTMGYGYATNQTHYCRLYTRANVEASTGFNTGSIFYPYTEVICANTSQLVRLDCPTKLPAKTDIKISGVASFAGIATIALRGWLE